MKAYAIFEGGGAKGYAHIGAVRATEDRGFEFDALAGTSIGAVIAALLAAGYSGTDLFEVRPDGRCEGLLSFDPIDRLNRDDWNKFQDFKNSPFYVLSTSESGKRSTVAVRAELASLSKLGRCFFRVCVSCRRSFLQVYHYGHLWITAHLAMVRHWDLFRTVQTKFGVTGSEGLSDFLDNAIREKLRETIDIPDSEPIRFRHLKPLRIIASDLVSEDLIVFGGNPDGLVVEAVVASATFPLFFRPARIDRAMLVDGGLLSNNPVWVFDEERAARPQCIPTFGFLLIDPPLGDARALDRAPRTINEFLIKLVRTTLYGRKRLETRAVEEYYPVSIEAGIETLDLHQAFKQAPALIARGYEDTKQALAIQIGLRDPLQMKAVLSILSATIYGALKPLSSKPGPVECAIILPKDKQFARIAYTSYQPADDSGISIRINSTGPSSCFALREPILTVIDEVPEAIRRGPLHRVEHSVRPQNMRVAYSVPVFSRAEDWGLADPLLRAKPIAVLCTYFSEDVRGQLQLANFENLFATYSQLIGLILQHCDSKDWLQQPLAHDNDIDAWTGMPDQQGFFISSLKTRKVGGIADMANPLAEHLRVEPLVERLSGQFLSSHTS